MFYNRSINEQMFAGGTPMAQQESITFVDFIRKFPNENACHQYLFNVRWPEGFKCPICNNDSYYYLSDYQLYQCKSCEHQASVTAGTVMHKTRVPLVKWFLALFLVATDKRGCSALTLQRHIEVNYKTAWLMLHKIRFAMSERDKRYMLEGIIQLDEAYFGGPNGKQGRGTGKAPAFVAVSTAIPDNTDKPHEHATIPLFAKIKVTDKLSMDIVKDFVNEAIVTGSKIVTDYFGIYNALPDNGFEHEQFLSGTAECDQALDWTHIVISNAKAFILGTYHGLSKRHLQAYVDEYCYRFNRRDSIKQLFSRLLNACASTFTITWDELTDTCSELTG
jgi:transposase-like protein